MDPQFSLAPTVVKDAGDAVVLQESETVSLAIPELEDETALSFVSVRDLSVALKDIGWNGGEEARLLTEIARDKGEGGRVRLLAMDAIRKRVIDALRFSGRLVKQTVKAQTEEPSKIDDVTKIVKSMQQTSWFAKETNGPNRVHREIEDACVRERPEQGTGTDRVEVESVRTIDAVSEPIGDHASVGPDSSP